MKKKLLRLAILIFFPIISLKNRPNEEILGQPKVERFTHLQEPIELLQQVGAPAQFSNEIKAEGLENLAQAETPVININLRTLQDAIVLTMTAKSEYTEIVESVPQVREVSTNAHIQHGITDLMTAAKNGQIAVVERLLHGPKINMNMQRRLGGIALMLAAQNGHDMVVERLLIIHGINVNMQDQLGITPLMSAAQKGHIAIVEQLLEASGIEVNLQCALGSTALRLAQQSNGPNKDAVIKLLLAHGATE